ncbi:MAG TPA: pseudaminic acid biosynthesis-associated methylase [Anaerolineae bacterium]|nr:pseudaminic acid biosynthesis-associated methylase [Anaerolineae bacterium]
MTYKTEQEQFWSGEFGDAYIERNQGAQAVATNLSLFAQILRSTRSVKSVIEFGANIGLNLEAIGQLLPRAELSAIEINGKAIEQLKAKGNITTYHRSILEFSAEQLYDFVLIKGVLIHINPEALPDVYQRLYDSSRRYICMVEYYNPTPVEVPYRGHSERLFKRDFAGDMLDKFPDLSLVDYGFVYRRDHHFPQDDCTWFLMEKRRS